MKILFRIWQFWLSLFYGQCPKCGVKAVVFSHEEHFAPGSPNVYVCKNCGGIFV